MKASLKIIISLVTLAGLLTSANAAVVTVSTADGNGGDAHVRRGNPDSNYGGLDHLEAQDGANTSDRKAYLRFDLTGISDEIYAASLELVWVSFPTGSDVIDVYGLNDGYAGGSGILGEDWLEGAGTESAANPGEITWNNAPGNTVGSSAGFNANATLLGQISVNFDTLSVGDTVSFSSAGLLSFLNADTDNNVTIMMSEDGLGITRWASSEHPTFAAPTLLLDVAVPEPGSLALLMVGGVLIGMTRRNRRG